MTSRSFVTGSQSHRGLSSLPTPHLSGPLVTPVTPLSVTDTAELGVLEVGVGPFGGAAGLPTVGTVLGITVNPTVSDATGPELVISFGFSSPGAVAMQMVRVQIERSDAAMANPTSQFFYDSGWAAQTLASGSSGSFTVDAVTAGIPTDTGSGSADPELHLVAIVSVSQSLNPAVSGVWASASTGAFDIQWGAPTLQWTEEPSGLTITPQALVGWLLGANRGYPQGSWEVQVASTDGLTIFYDSGQTAGTFNGVLAVPPNAPYLVVGQSYQITVFAWNTNGVPAPPLTVVTTAGFLEPVAVPVGGPLRRFLSMLAFQLDYSRSLLEQLRNANNPLECPGNLLPALAQELGVAYEADMGMTQTRMLLADIVHEYKIKGTYPGIAGISTAVTGWGASVAVGPNQMLSLAQHLAQTPVTNLTATAVANVDGVPSVPGYAGASAPTGWPGAVTVPPLSGVSATAWFDALAPTTAVTHTLVLSTLGSGTPLEYGIPIVPSTTVSGSVWLWAGGFGSVPSFSFDIRFWGAMNTNLGTAAAATAAVPSVGAWTQYVLNDVTVPAGTVWASLELSSASALSFSAVNDIVVTAFPYLQAGTSVAAYTRPRELLITLDADRVNLVANPSFENAATTGWAATTNCTIAPSTAASYHPPGVANPGTHSLKVTATANGAMTITSAMMPIEEVELYTATAYVFAPVAPRAAQATLLFYDTTITLLDSTPGTALYEGGGATGTASVWTRINAQVPPNAPLPATTVQGALTITWVGCLAGEAHFVDCVMVEQGWAVKPYFDGGIWDGAPSAPDYIWETPGTPLGPSFYYQNYFRSLVRLYAVLAGNPQLGAAVLDSPTSQQAYGQQSPLTLTGFVPLGLTFTLIAPQPEVIS